MRIASIISLAVISLAVLVCGTARAQPDPAEATRLFDEGRALATTGDLAAACDRFARSFALVPAAGTQLNLADCYERRGLLAEAWRNFDKVATEATRAGNAKRATYARERADAIAPKLTTVILKVAHADLHGLAITINGRTIPTGAKLREVVDPGDIAVAATAPSSPGFARSTRGAAGATVEFDVPALDAAAIQDQTPVLPGPATERNRGRVRVAWGLAGLAGASAIASIGFLTVGRVDYTGAADSTHCMRIAGRLFCDDPGSAQIRHSQRLADVSTAFALGAGSLLAAAAAVYFTAPHDAVVVPVAGGNGIGLAVTASF